MMFSKAIRPGPPILESLSRPSGELDTHRIEVLGSQEGTDI